MLYIIFSVKYIKQKQYKDLAFYTLTMVIAGVASLIIFPYSIQHMFFGYRGQGAIGNLTDISKFINQISSYLQKLNYFAFNNLLVLILLIIICLYYKKKTAKPETKIETSKYLKLIALPTLFYFVIAAVSSPWIELRYIMPVCGLIFILVMYYLYKLIITVYNEKISNIIIGVLLILTLVSPFIFKIEPEVLYSDKNEIVQKLENELNIPTVFFFNSNNNRFLDDILLFAKLNESYIAKDIEYTETNIEKILDKKDISKGMVIFINEGQDNDNIINVVLRASGLNNCEYLKRLNACDVYYLK